MASVEITDEEEEPSLSALMGIIDRSTFFVVFLASRSIPCKVKVVCRALSEKNVRIFDCQINSTDLLQAVV
jgi:hypothetical protein